MSLPPENTGDRPSRLALDRFAAGELKGPDRAAVQAWLAAHPEGLAHLESLRRAKQDVQRPDLAALRARAAAMDPPARSLLDEPAAAPARDVRAEPEHDDRATQPFAEDRIMAPPAAFLDDAYSTDSVDSSEEVVVERTPNQVMRLPLPAPIPAPTSDLKDIPAHLLSAPAPAPANAPRWVFAAVPVLALAAAALFAILVVPSGSAPEEVPVGVRVKGEPILAMSVLEGDRMRAWDGRPLKPGDTVGFEVSPAGRESVVLLSMDGAGRVTVLHPPEGDAPAPLSDVTAPLPGSFVLDGASGPEAFVAVFGVTVADARHKVARHKDAAAAAAWAKADPDADVVLVRR